jgi:hypothetical protein
MRSKLPCCSVAEDARAARRNLSSSLDEQDEQSSPARKKLKGSTTSYAAANVHRFNGSLDALSDHDVVGASA